MQTERGRIASYIAAGLLALVVLFVFGSLRDYGPESAIRRFQEAIRQDDASALRAVTIEPISARSVQALLAQVGQVVNYGRGFRVVRTDRSTDRVIAATATTGTDGTPMFVLWVVVKENAVWKISATDTLRANLNASQAASVPSK